MKKYSISCLIVSSLMILAACSSKNDSQLVQSEVAQTLVEGSYELSETQFESSEMKLGNLIVQPFYRVVKTNGMFDVPPENRASVSSYFGGVVKNLQLLTGERVKKGQVLFTLENPDFVQIQQDFLEAKGQLKYLKSDYERQKNLAQDNVSSQKNFLKAESDYIVTSVRVESLSKKLTLMNINPNLLTIEKIHATIAVISPIDGYVTGININKGSYLNSSQVAIDIVNTNHLHLELNVFEKDISKVNIGQTIKFRIQEDQSNQYEGVVHLVNKTVDPENRTIGIHGHILNEKVVSKFNPGMYVEAEIYSTSELKSSIPEDALVEVESKYYALVLQDTVNGRYSFEKREIKAGVSNNGFVEVLNSNDFNDSTQFLIKGSFNLITE